jgi:hypothetical protein
MNRLESIYRKQVALPTRWDGGQFQERGRVEPDGTLRYHLGVASQVEGSRRKGIATGVTQNVSRYPLKGAGRLMFGIPSPQMD